MHGRTADRLRRILQAKGTKAGSGRSSRAGSPAMPAPSQSNPFASAFQPPTANGFNFSAPGSTPAPNFGEQAQQNGTSFGAPVQNGTPSFGGFGSTQSNATPNFGFGAGSNTTQPQQNGFNPSTSFSFGGNAIGTSATQAPSFQSVQSQSPSQTPQTQQNGFTPSTQTTSVFGGSFGGQPGQQNGGSSFTFGQKPEEQTPKPSSQFSFGQPPQQNGDKPNTTGLFGSVPAAETPNTGASVFSAVPNKTNGIKAGMFTQSQQVEQTPKPALNFGQPAHVNGEQQPKATTGFGGYNFSQPSEQTPKASSGFTFGQTPQPPTQETPKPAANSFKDFNFGQQSNEPEKQTEQAQKPNDLFSRIEKPDQTRSASAFKVGEFQKAQETPKASNMFPGFGQSAAAPSFKFAAVHQEDTSMMSPDNTPQKQTTTQNVQQDNTTGFGQSEPERPAETNVGKSLFDRITRDEPAAAPKASNDLDLFSKPAASSSASNLFWGSTNFPSDATPKPSSSMFTSASTGVPSAAPWLNSLLARAASQTSSTQDPTAPPASFVPASVLASKVAAAASRSAKPVNVEEIRSLNEGLLAHLQDEDPNNDWSSIFQYYMREAATIMGKEAFVAPTAPAQAAPETGATPAVAKPPSAPTEQSRPSFMNSTSTPKPSSTGMFGQQQQPSNFFGSMPNPPATAPISKKRSADEELTKSSSGEPAAPATEKRVKPSGQIEYPKLPATASETAKLFASTLEKPASKAVTPWNAPTTNDASGEEEERRKMTKSPMFGPPADVLAKVREQEAAKKAQVEKATAPTPAFKPSTTPMFSTSKPAASSPEKPAEAPKAPTFGFTPSTPSSSSAAPPGLPTFTAPAGGANFFSAFGAKANKNAEKEKKRRKDEDYDSEEEDEAAWEARDKQKQEEARKQFEEAAKKGTGFVIKPTESSSKSNGLFDSLHTRTAAAEDQETDEASANSSVFGAPKATGKQFAGFKFGQATVPNAGEDEDEEADKPQAEKVQGTGNHTWNPNTPIKFGSAVNGNQTTTPAAAPPSNLFSGLFGSNATPAVGESGSEAGKLAPPSMGFNFGPSNGTSLGGSRATTPGMTTDGEGSIAGDDGEPAEQQNEKQIDDMTALLPEEREAEEVLLELEMARASKMDDKRNEDGTTGFGWVDRGKGPLYLLKNKQTGKTRVLIKMSPLGKEAMNFEPKASFTYEVPSGKPKYIKGAFFDHLGPKEKAGSPSTWLIQVREAEDAKEIARILMEGRQ